MRPGRCATVRRPDVVRPVLGVRQVRGYDPDPGQPVYRVGRRRDDVPVGKRPGVSEVRPVDDGQVVEQVLHHRQGVYVRRRDLRTRLSRRKRRLHRRLQTEIVDTIAGRHTSIAVYAAGPTPTHSAVRHQECRVRARGQTAEQLRCRELVY